MADSKTRLKFALELAKLGFLIAPLTPETKIPYAGESWLNMATTDPDTIIAWFRDRPNMNYAVSPGGNCVVIDPDVKTNKQGVTKNGVRDLEEMEIEAGEFGAFSSTFTVQTPSGGEHRYFTTDFEVGNSNEGFPRSIDVRGRGGYVVGPGCHTSHNAASNTFEGEYVVVTPRRPIAKFPDFAVARLRKYEETQRERYDDQIEVREGKEFLDNVELDTPDRIERATEWLKVADPAIEGQGGNNKTFATFAWLREHAISEVTAFHLVNEHYNPRCQPEWSFEELGRVCENAYRYAKRQVNEAGGLLDRGLSEEEMVAQSEDVTPLLLRAFNEATRNIEDLSLLEARIERNKIDDDLEAHAWSGDDIFDRPVKKEFVIPGVLPASGYTGFLARRGTGKTTILLDMMLRLGHDMDWHGKPCQKGWVVVYLAGEDAEGIADQVAAWKMAHGIFELDRNRVIFMDEIVDLLDAASVKKWTDFLKKKVGDRRCIVIGDTWQTATAAGSQNEDDTMQLAIKHIKQMAKALRGPAIMAAHPPKQNEDTWSGAAVLENGSQALWKLSAESTHLKFGVSRIKGTRAGHYVMFKFEEHFLGGHSEFGEPYTGLVPLKIGGEGHVATDGEKQVEVQRRTSFARLIYDMMNQAEEHEADFAKKRTTAFSMSGTSDRVLTMARKDDPMLTKLKMLGETFGDDTRAIRRRLAELFMEQPGAVVVDEVNGQTISIYLHQASKTRTYFKVIGSATPESDEPESDPPETPVQT